MKKLPIVFKVLAVLICFIACTLLGLAALVLIITFFFVLSIKALLLSLFWLLTFVMFLGVLDSLIDL